MFSSSLIHQRLWIVSHEVNISVFHCDL